MTDNSPNDVVLFVNLTGFRISVCDSALWVDILHISFSAFVFSAYERIAFHKFHFWVVPATNAVTP